MRAIGWLVVGMLAGLGTAAAQPVDPGAGRVLAERLCAGCHLMPGAAGPVPDGVPSFAAIARNWDDRVRLADRMLVPPHPQMPEPPLGRYEREAVAAWILSLRP